LKACLRFFDLLSNPLHTRAVREEIDMVRWDEQPRVEYDYGDGSEDVFLPCPFTSYLFYVALAAGEGTSPGSIMDAKMSSLEAVRISLLIAF
jgi:hypothetical protein